MELFGILFSVPAAFLASVVYAAVLKHMPLPHPLKPLAKWASLAVLFALVVEWTLLVSFGAVRCRASIGPSFYVVHSIIFFLAVPALVNILVLSHRDRVRSWWLMIGVGVLSAVLAFPVVLTQYAVSEALYGVDGYDGPYSAK